MAKHSDRKEKKLVWNAVTESCTAARMSVTWCWCPGSNMTSSRAMIEVTLKSRCSTWAAISSRCGCANQALPVAVKVMAANLARLLKLRRGVQAVWLHKQQWKSVLITQLGRSSFCSTLPQGCERPLTVPFVGAELCWGTPLRGCISAQGVLPCFAA